MKADHSPAPWRWVRERDSSDQGAIFDANDVTVCSFGDDTLYYPVEGQPPDDADLALILKAPLLPELAEALRMLLRTNGTPRYDDEIHADKTARAALARYDEEG